MISDFLSDGSCTFTISGESTKELLRMLEEQDKEYLKNLFDGQETLTLKRGEKQITLAPVKHSKWYMMRGNYEDRGRCMRCGTESRDVGRYCGHCGARMEE